MMSDKHLDIFDKFLDDMTNSKITNKDYEIIHKIFDKYLSKKQANQQRKEVVMGFVELVLIPLVLYVGLAIIF